MSRISSVFKPGHKALIAYVTVGYPSIEATLKAIPLLAKNGCDIVELGIPFSDPLADGATIQNASFHALENGVTPKVCLDVAKQLKNTVDIPLVFMTYYNPVLNYGLDKFCGACNNVGIGGLIIPDLPVEEGYELEPCTEKHGLDLIYLLAPTSTDKRIRLVTERSSGFIYLVSLTGVTGSRDRLPVDLDKFVARVRKMTKKPLCVGFGISTSEQAREISRLADGIIVGSRIIQLMETDSSLKAVGRFARKLRQAIDSPEK